MIRACPHRADAKLRVYAATLLREAQKVQRAHGPAFQMRGLRQNGRHGRNALATHAGDQQIPCLTLNGGQAWFGRQWWQRDGGGARRFRADQADEGRAETLNTRKILIAGRLVNTALAPKRCFNRLHRQAIGCAGAIAAILTNARIDRDAAIGARRQIPLALAAAFGGAFLIIDDDGDALHRAQFLLHRIKPRTMMKANRARDQRIAAMPVWIVGDNLNAPHTFAMQLRGDVGYINLAFRGLPAGHGDSAIHQNLESDIGLGGDSEAHGKTAGMGIGAIAHISKNMFLAGEMFLPYPGGTFTAHLAEEIRIAVHEAREVMAANAGQGAAAFRHAG